MKIELNGCTIVKLEDGRYKTSCHNSLVVFVSEDLDLAMEFCNKMEWNK
jgi:hypothetical protein